MIQKIIYYLSRPSIPRIYLLNRNKIDVCNDFDYHILWSTKNYIDKSAEFGGPAYNGNSTDKTIM